MTAPIKILYALLAVLLLYTIWPSEQDMEKAAANIRVWDTHVNDQGHLDVLGVVLGQSTLKDAEQVLHTQSERALFVDVQDQEHKGYTLEAYFPTSPDRAKLYIELDASDALITQIKERAYKATVFPSGNAKLEIAPEQMADVEASIVKSITYQPPISLQANVVEKNFGPAQKTIKDKDGNLHMLYPAIGLDVVIATQGKPLLQFVAPAEFDRLLNLLHIDESHEVPQ